eukprot:CAMPEP_0196214922 /NCGR_PEP_ID=MMETSP0912-20130531/28681_1 /TAXON_ID=49265 /ORGANISM="Thalassiosira rotula, Strain GSO102" /LENGTH=65 /DNA_ID=CAMNT_0041491679 /DNA_START=53 /DNA_END=246 /DNA_ORIENTATION=-
MARFERVLNVVDAHVHAMTLCIFGGSSPVNATYVLSATFSGMVRVFTSTPFGTIPLVIKGGMQIG